MPPLQCAVWVPTYAWPNATADGLQRLRASIRKCEEYGFDIWTIDHLLTAPGLYGVSWLDPLGVLQFAAALTSHVRLATGILVLPVRHPIVLAKEIASLAYLSGERFMLGVGPGWNAREFEVTGSRIEERGRRCDEMLDAVTRLLTQERASFAGRFYAFSDVTIDPRPRSMPPVWVAGGSKEPDPKEHDQPVLAKAVANRIVRAGNWMARAAARPEWIVRDWQQLQDHARSLGKDRRALTFGHCNFVHLTETTDNARAVEAARDPFLRVMGTHRSWEHLQETYMIGSPEQVCARIAALVGAGLQYLVLGPVADDPNQIDLLARHVFSNFR